MTKSMVTKLLAMAVTASVALANGGGEDERKGESLYQGGGGWSFKPGAGVTYDGGDTFKLTMKNRLQVQWGYANFENAADVNSFNIRRARTDFSGHIHNKDILYKLQMQWTDSGGNSSLLDGWVHWYFSSQDTSKIGLRMGQGKPGYGLEFTGGSETLDLIERSMATKVFADTRTRGAWLWGGHNENKLRWNFGVVNGDVAAGAVGNLTDAGEEVANSGNEPSYVAAVNFDPLGDMVGGKTTEGFTQGDLEHSAETRGTIGVGVFVGNDDAVTGGVGGGVPGTEVETLSWNVNTAWKMNGICLMGEYHMRSDDPDGAGGEEDTDGWYVQGSYAMAKSGDSDMQWGFAARVSMVSADTTSSFLNLRGPLGTQTGITGATLLFDNEDVMEFTAGVNAFYRGHQCKTQINYVYQDRDTSVAATDQTNHMLLVMMTLVF